MVRGKSRLAFGLPRALLSVAVGTDAPSAAIVRPTSVSHAIGTRHQTPSARDNAAYSSTNAEERPSFFSQACTVSSIRSPCLNEGLVRVNEAKNSKTHSSTFKLFQQQQYSLLGQTMDTACLYSLTMPHMELAAMISDEREPSGTIG